MKTSRIKILLLLATLTLTSLIVAMAQPRPPEGRADHPRTIVVMGDGEVSAAPDQAVVRLGATAQTDQADVAQSQVNAKIEKALEGIEKLGVSRRSIHTSGITLMPVYEQVKFPNGTEQPRVVGFRANNMLEVTLTDTKLVGKVIDTGIAAGVNELQGVSFGLKNDLNQRMTALTLASQEAQTKAESIAKALGLRLAGVLEVTEGGATSVPFNEGFGGARMMTTSKAGRTPVEPGEVKVHASVTVRYEIGNARAER